MSDKERPAEPAEGDKGTDRGGFADVAKHLNKEFPVRRRPISRQLVHKWWLYRHSNRFPEAIDSTGRGNGGKGRPVFDLNAVAAWYDNYKYTRATTTGSTQRHVTTERVTGDGDSLAA